MTSEKAKIPQC